MMVAVALFSIVMVVSTGALLALVSANRKAQALQSVMNNLNTAVDGMVRAVRMGATFHCGNTGSYGTVQDCINGDTLFAFEPFGGTSATTNDQWVYWYDASTKRIKKSENGGATNFTLTAPEVEIDEATFYVLGSTEGDAVQPKVVIVVRGTAGAGNAKTRTTFNIQATAVQRILDL